MIVKALLVVCLNFSGNATCERVLELEYGSLKECGREVYQYYTQPRVIYAYCTKYKTK